MTEAIATFSHDDRIAVRFGSAQMVLREWVLAARRQDPERASERENGSFVFLRTPWTRPARQLVVTIRPVPHEDTTAVRLEVHGTVRSARFQRYLCRALLRRLSDRALRLSHEINSNPPGGGLRIFSGGLRRQPIPIRRDEDPETQLVRRRRDDSLY